MNTELLENLNNVLENLLFIDGFTLFDNDVIRCCEDADVKVTFIQKENRDVAVLLDDTIKIKFHNGMDLMDFYNALDKRINKN